MEIELVEIFKKLFQVKQVSVFDNFFSLGGDSLLVPQLINSIEHEIGIKPHPEIIFKAKNLRELAISLDNIDSFIPTTYSMLTDVLEKDVLLENNIYPKASYRFIEKPTNIFLTGVSGFCGAFLFSELVKNNRSSKIYCLVRANSKEEGLEKIKINIQKYSLWDDSFIVNIIPVLGDLEKKYLGIDNDEFKELSNHIEIIFHLAAVLSFSLPYSNLKPANVNGTHEILRLSTFSKNIPIHYFSTIGIFLNSLEITYDDKDNRKVDQILEENSLRFKGKIRTGYAQSKWVAERLMEEARLRGVPVTIYRLGLVEGNSSTGITNYTEFTYSFLKASIQHNLFPKSELEFLFIPVDIIAQCVLVVSSHEELCGKNYHLCPKNSTSVEDYIKLLRNFGYQISLSTYPQWKRKVSESNLIKSLSDLLPDVQHDPWSNQPRINSKKTWEILEKYQIYSKNFEEIFPLYLNYLVEIGFLPKPL